MPSAISPARTPSASSVGPDEPRLAVAELAHRVEEMRRHPRSGGEGAPPPRSAPVSLCPRLTTAPAAASAAICAVGGALRRQRHDERRQPPGRRAEHRRGRRRPSAGSGAGSCAPLRRGSRCGPSRCSPRKPGTPAAAAATPAAIAARRDLAGVGDQRRQQPGGAEPGVGGADRPDAVEVGAVVQHHPAAAVHLQVDEARAPARRRRAGPARPPGAWSGGRIAATRPSSTTSAAPACSALAVEDRRRRGRRVLVIPSP